MLIQTETWEWKDYWGLLEYLLRKLLKEGIIQNIEQYLSALCKSLTSALLFVGFLFFPSLHASLFVWSLGRLWARFSQGHLLINILKHKTKAEVRKPKSSCETGAAGCQQGSDLFVSSMAALLMMNDSLFVEAPVVTSLSMRLRLTVL